MYSFRNIFIQDPETVKGVVLVIAAALVGSEVITLTGQEAALWGIALERLLGLFYVRPLSMSKDAFNQLADVVDQGKPRRPLKAAGRKLP